MRTPALTAAIALVAGLTGASPAVAAERFEFLFLDGGARPAAMGGAYSALASDAHALQYNAAGLALTRSNEATFLHESRFAGITHQHAAFSSHQGWGLELKRLDFGSVPRATYTNPTGAGLGDSRLEDLSLAAGYGMKLSRFVALGGVARGIVEKLDESRTSAFAFDLGLMASIPDKEAWRFAFALQNIGPNAKSDARSEPLPLLLRMGASNVSKPADLLLISALDFTRRRDGAVAVHAGVEVQPVSNFSVRFGLDSSRDAALGMTAGLGIRRGQFAFDYAFAPYGELGSSHRISVSLRWGLKSEPTDTPIYGP